MKDERVTLTEISRILKRSRSTVQSWPLTKGDDGLYSLEEARAHSDSARPRKTNGTRDGESETHSEARRREAVAKADKAELEVAEKRKELVNADDVRRELERAFAACQTRILAIPSQLAPKLSKKPMDVVKREMTKSLKEALAGLAEWEGGEDE